MRPTHIQMAFDVVDYVLSDDKEELDFLENPSDNHVYYKCLYARDGYTTAEAALANALRESEQGEAP
jgi:hypothetical protein